MQLELDSLEPLLASFADKIVNRLAPAPAPVESMTFGELFSLYFEQRIEQRTRDTRNARYFFALYGPRWSNIPVHEITRKSVQAWLDALGPKGQLAANRALDVMRATINWGIYRELIPISNNPCVGVEKFKLRSRKRFAAPDELIRLKAALDEESDLMRDFFWMCLLTGARRGNVQSMTWTEIDFDLSTWTIPAEKFKTGDSHTLPLNSLALSILHRRWRARRESRWVFPSPKTAHHITEPRRAWKRVLKRASISDLRIHDLRRTMGSYLAINGANQYVIAQMLGHKDVRSTAIYARLNLAAVRKAAEIVSENWQVLLAEPAKTAAATKLLEVKRQEPVRLLDELPKNADIQITGADQVIVEGKILTAIRAGGTTKKHFYRKIGAHFQINSTEMERILNEMVEKKLIEHYRDDLGVHRYAQYGQHPILSVGVLASDAAEQKQADKRSDCELSNERPVAPPNFQIPAGTEF